MVPAIISSSSVLILIGIGRFPATITLPSTSRNLAHCCLDLRHVSMSFCKTLHPFVTVTDVVASCVQDGQNPGVLSRVLIGHHGCRTRSTFFSMTFLSKKSCNISDKWDQMLISKRSIHHLTHQRLGVGLLMLEDVFIRPSILCASIDHLAMLLAQVVHVIRRWCH